MVYFVDGIEKTSPLCLSVQVFVKGVVEYQMVKLDEIRKHYPDIEYMERNIEPDHVHIVVSFPPKYSIAKVVQIMKQNKTIGSDLQRAV